MKEKLIEVPLSPMYHCPCQRFYAMPYLGAHKKLVWQVKDFIGGGTCVYLHATFEDALERISECGCCKTEETFNQE